MPPSAVTSTSSIIIILTLVHPFATSWPSSPKGDARTLRDWLSVSYVTQYPVPPIFSFPLEVARNWIHRGEKRPANPVTRFPVGERLEEAKGVQGRAPIGYSLAVLTANRRTPKRSDATFLHNPWHRGPEARWMPYAPLRRRRRPLREYWKAPSFESSSHIGRVHKAPTTDSRQQKTASYLAVFCFSIQALKFFSSRISVSRSFSSTLKEIRSPSPLT